MLGSTSCAHINESTILDFIGVNVLSGFRVANSRDGESCLSLRGNAHSLLELASEQTHT